jgi:hypothetical protein
MFIIFYFRIFFVVKGQKSFVDNSLNKRVKQVVKADKQRKKKNNKGKRKKVSENIKVAESDVSEKKLKERAEKLANNQVKRLKNKIFQKLKLKASRVKSGVSEVKPKQFCPSRINRRDVRSEKFGHPLRSFLNKPVVTDYNSSGLLFGKKLVLPFEVFYLYWPTFSDSVKLKIRSALDLDFESKILLSEELHKAGISKKFPSWSRFSKEISYYEVNFLKKNKDI